MDTDAWAWPGGSRWAVRTSQAMASLLVAVPAGGPSVCPVCHGRASGGRMWCFPCAQTATQLGRSLAPVVPVSLYRPGGGLHHCLRGYKDACDPDERRRGARAVAGLLARFLWQHGACVAPGGWDAITTVPSTGGRPGEHPLARALDEVGRVPGLARLLEPGPAAARVDHRLADHDAFRPAGDVAGARLLVVDDTFTTGARAQSAAATLEAAGAEVAAVVVAGRVVSPGASPAVARWWAEHARPGDPALCCVPGAHPGARPTASCAGGPVPAVTRTA